MRMIVRSCLKPPLGVSSGVYTTRPTGTFIWRIATCWTVLRAPGPVTSKIANALRSIIAARSRIARCSALMIGDHQRDSHSASRFVTLSPYSSSNPAFDSYQFGRSHPAPSTNTALSSRSRS